MKSSIEIKTAWMEIPEMTLINASVLIDCSYFCVFVISLSWHTLTPSVLHAHCQQKVTMRSYKLINISSLTSQVGGDWDILAL